MCSTPQITLNLDQWPYGRRVRYAKALFDFEATVDSMPSFKKSDMFLFVELKSANPNSSTFWTCKREDPFQEGLVQKNFVEEITAEQFHA